MRNVGKRGEIIVSNLLSGRGYKIIAKNLRLGKDEIDVIAYKSNTHYLIEVKTINRSSTVKAGQQMTAAKRRYFERAAQKYIKKFQPARIKLLFAEVEINVITGSAAIAITRYR